VSPAGGDARFRLSRDRTRRSAAHLRPTGPRTPPPFVEQGRAGPDRLLHRLVSAAACVVAVLLTARAVLTIDPFFDTFAYHLPFAARAAGLCPQSCYRMGELLEARYTAFPPVYDALQGVFWRLLGSPQAVDLLNIALLAGFAFYLRRTFAVPSAWTIAGFLAVPLIQIHLTASYIDLPLNLLIGIAVLAIFDIQRDEGQPGWRRPALAVACLAFAANSKLTMFPVAAVLGGWLFLVLAVRLRTESPRPGPDPTARSRGWLVLFAATAVSGAVVFASALHNLIVLGNPIYPVQLDIAGLRLPGPEAVMAPGEDSLAPYWRDIPSPLRWVASVLEVGGYGARPLPWTHDQGFWLTAWPLEPFETVMGPSFRMGGYFVAYVLFLLGFISWQVRSLRARQRTATITVFVLVTGLAAALPHSHELRYNLFWIIVVVALCLICAFAQTAAEPRRRAQGVLAAGMLVALASVVLLTRGWYLMPTERNLADLRRDLGIERQLRDVADGETICIDPGWQPFTFLFAPVFHPGRSYSVLDGAIGPCTRTIAPLPHG